MTIACTNRTLFLLAGACAIPLFAQHSTPGKSYDLAVKWIADSEARHRAWAAQLIARGRFEPLYPELPGVLSELGDRTSGSFSGTADELALEAVADAIVKTNTPVPAMDARRLYPVFPALAMILLSRTSDDNRTALASILEQAKVGEVWLAAANLLARNPPAGFVAGLLDDFRPFVRVLVTEPGTGAGMSYGDCFAPARALAKFKIPDDWPAFSVYSLAVAGRDGTVLAPGNTAVRFAGQEARGEVDVPWTGIATCGGLNLQKLRRGLIAQMAEMDAGILNLQDVVLRTVVRENDAQYRRDVIQILSEQAASFHAIVMKMRSTGLLTQAEADERRLHIDLHIVPMATGAVLPSLPDLAPLGIVAGETRNQ